MLTRREFIGGTLLAASTLLLSGYNQTLPKVGTMNHKAILLGIDGFDPRIMRAMMQAGELPHFRTLAERGSFSALATSNPPQSPVAWSCIATGQNPGKHGVFDFLMRYPEKYLPDLGILRLKKGGAQLLGPSFVKVRQGKAFWELLTEAGIPTTVVRWPVAFPPEEVAARILAGLGTPDIRGGLGRYTFYTNKAVGSHEEGKEKVIPVRMANNQIQTEIQGPLTSGLSGKKAVQVPLVIAINGDKREAILKIQDQEVPIREKGWSPWIRIKFKVGFFQHVYGLCKFYLSELEPTFALYLTPLQIDPQEPCFPISHPPGYAAELAAKIGPYYTLGIPEDTKAVTENRLEQEAFVEMCYQIIREQEAMLALEMERFKQGVLAFVFFSSDRLQHIFWASQDPTHPLYNDAYLKHYGRVIGDCYRDFDRILGQYIMPQVDDKTFLMVCSDHGFTSFRRTVHLNTWLAGNGFMDLDAQAAASDANAGSLFQFVDWGRTKAYAMGLGSIYLNLRGREGQGIIPAAHYNQAQQEIREKLLRLTDPQTGKPVVKAVYTRQEIYAGSYLEDAPDLIVGFADGYRVSWQTAIGGAPAALIEDNLQKWTGDHCVDPSLVPGVLFMNRKIARNNPSLLDIAPTLLAYFGLPASTDGKALI